MKTIALCMFALGCSSSSNTDIPDTGSTTNDASAAEISTQADTGGSACTLTANTTPTTVVSSSGCAVLDRDVSACAADRANQGLSGFWLDFSCRVTLTASTGKVNAKADGQPDYLSNYFPADNVCHEVYTGAKQNPNDLMPKTYDIAFPTTSDNSPTVMQLGVVGLAVNGVPIFGNFAAPGDDIFVEADTFDRCAAHPTGGGMYHYHSEPLAISQDDDRFIGVLRDGYPVYGRKDMDGSYPTLDAQGGHTGVTKHSPTTPVYHYHVNLQTSTAQGTAGQTQWFVTTGTYHGGPSACPDCN